MLALVITKKRAVSRGVTLGVISREADCIVISLKIFSEKYINTSTQ